MSTLFLKNVDRVLGSFLVRLMTMPSAGNDVERPEVSRVLVIRPGGIGDAALLVPALRKLRLMYPVAVIDVLAEKRNAGVFSLCDVHDHVYCYDKFSDLRELFSQRYDLVIDTEQWHRLSVVFARLLRPGCLVGFATNDRSRLLHHGVEYSQEDYELESFLHLLEPLGPPLGFAVSSHFLKIPSQAGAVANHLLNQLSSPFVCMFPGASIAERRWEEGKFSKLIKLLSSLGVASVLVGGEDDREIGAAIASGSTVVNLVGQTTLAETAAILQASSCLVSGDSGVLHLAVGLDVPTVSLFGPGRRLKWAPKSSRHIVIDHQLECSPCTTFGTTPKCKRGAACLAGIEVDEVFVAVSGHLKTWGENV